MRTVLITGVSGFVGRAVAMRLLATPDTEVVGLARTDPGIPGLHFIRADITLPSSLPNDLGQVAIVHTAALAADDWQSGFEEVNHRGTRHALRLAPEAPFVHLSTSSVYDLGRASQLTAEDAFSPVGYRFYNGYAASKACAEVALLESETYRGMPPVSLRPHAVYGPGDNHLLPRLRARVRHGHLPLPDGGRHLHSLTHIDNLVQGIELALDHAPKAVEAFNISDANPMQLREAIRAIEPGLKLHTLPTRQLLGLVKLGAPISEYEVRQLGFERTYSIARARTRLGFMPTDFVASV